MNSPVPTEKKVAKKKHGAGVNKCEINEMKCAEHQNNYKKKDGLGIRLARVLDIFHNLPQFTNNESVYSSLCLAFC